MLASRNEGKIVRRSGTVGAIVTTLIATSAIVFPHTATADDQWTPGTVKIGDQNPCVPGNPGSQGTVAYYSLPTLTDPVARDTLYSDGNVTPAGHRRVQAQVRMHINTIGICFPQAPDAEVKLQTKF